jgi:hypothetical protein
MFSTKVTTKSLLMFTQIFIKNKFVTSTAVTGMESRHKKINTVFSVLQETIPEDHLHIPVTVSNCLECAVAIRGLKYAHRTPLSK